MEWLSCWPAARGSHKPLALVGISMGAYDAIRLTQTHAVGALVLMVPGVYTPAADETPFGPAFFAQIRRERSWAETDAWDILSRFEGELLVLAAGHDVVIPREIPERLVAGGEHNRVRALQAAQPARFDPTLAMVVEVVEVVEAVQGHR